MSASEQGISWADFDWGTGWFAYSATVDDRYLRASSPAGYYVHAGSVYLEGTLFSNAGVAPAGTTLITVPPEICPQGDLTFELPLLTADLAIPGFEAPNTATATLTTAGVLSLAELPPYINTAPSTPVGLITEPYRYQVVLSGISWPVVPVDGPIPGSGWKPIAPYLGDAFENIDAEIAVSGAQVACRGTVRALRNIATSVFQGTSYGGNPAPDFARFFPLLVGLGDLGAEAGEGLAVRLTNSRFGVTVAEFSGLTNDSDVTGGAAIDTSGHAYEDAPMLFLHTDGMMLGRLSNGGDDVAFGSPRRDSDTFAGVVDLVLPMDAPVPTFDEMANRPQGADGSWWTPGLPTRLSSVVGAVDAPVIMEDGAPYPERLSTIGGLSTHTVVPPAGGPNMYAAGKSWLDAITTGWAGVGVAEDGEYTGEDMPSSGTLTATATIPDFSAVFSVPPDYVLLLFQCWVPNPSFIAGLGVTPVLTSVTTDAGVFLDGLANVIGVTDENVQIALSSPSGYALGAVNTSTLFQAYLAPPAAPDYPDDPDNPGLLMLWPLADLPTTVSGASSYTTVESDFTQECTLTVSVSAVPFWKTRRNWILAGDILTLDDAAWPATYPPPIGPGNISAGPAAAGLLSL
jgi:hypothetical protein